MKTIKNTLLLLILFIVFSLPSNSQTTSLNLTIDGPDQDNKYSLNEVIRFGNLDHLGFISFGGDFTGARSKYLGSIDFLDDDFKGVLYEFNPITGGNNEFSHPNATLAIKINSPTNWQLSVYAQVSGQPLVGVDQLLFKEDDQREYKPFTPSPQIVSRGNSGIHHKYYDLALRIDRNDNPGRYVWQITYVLVAY